MRGHQYVVHLEDDDDDGGAEGVLGAEAEGEQKGRTVFGEPDMSIDQLIYKGVQ